MVLLRLTPMGLARSRFALSPLAETLGALITLTRPNPAPWQAAWHARHSPVLRARLDADAFEHGFAHLVGSSKFLPANVTLPPSAGMRTALADELAAAAAPDDDSMRAELTTAVAHSWEQHDLSSWLTGTGFAARSAELLRYVWERHVAPDWPRRRAVLEADVAHRAALLASHGWPRALEQMGRQTAWVGEDAVRFSSRPGPDRPVDGEGMLFVPVNIPLGSWLCEQPGRPYALVYPARGAARVFGGEAPAAAGPSSAALDRLVGPGRAAILRALERPATSSELAAEFGLSLGTVGGHLTVLREAGAVAGTRVGRRVVYRRTGLGTQLCGGG